MNFLVDIPGNLCYNTVRWWDAGVAQLVEQLICNQQVGGSNPSTSSSFFQSQRSEYGRVPEWPKGADCKSVVVDFGGSNPPSSTMKKQLLLAIAFSVIFALRRVILLRSDIQLFAEWYLLRKCESEYNIAVSFSEQYHFCLWLKISRRARLGISLSLYK